MDIVAGRCKRGQGARLRAHVTGPDARQHLRIEGRFLMRFEGHGISRDARTVGIGQLGRGLRQARAFHGVTVGKIGGVRHDGRDQAARRGQQVTHERLEVSRIGDIAFHRLQDRIAVERGDDVAVAHRDRQRGQEAFEHIRHAAAARIALLVFQVAQRSLQRGVLHALLGHLLQRGPDQRFGHGRLGLSEAFHADMEQHLARTVVMAIKARRPAVARRLHRVHQRCCGVAQQAGRQQARFKRHFRNRRLTHQPRHLQPEFVVAALLRRNAHGIALRRCEGAGELWHAPCRDIDLARQHALGNAGLDRSSGQWPGRHEDRLRRVVMAGVEVLEHLVRELGNGQRIAARIDFVGGAAEDGRGQALVQRVTRVGERALHFIEDHALVTEDAIGERVAPALLQEVQVIELREEGGVEVHVEQIVEIVFVGADERIHGAVGIGERIHEGRGGAAQHGEERIAHRIALRAAQRQVFEDVRAAIAGVGHGGETHQEGHVGAAGGQVDVARAGRRRDILFHRGLECRNGVTAEVLEMTHVRFFQNMAMVVVGHEDVRRRHDDHNALKFYPVPGTRVGATQTFATNPSIY